MLCPPPPPALAVGTRISWAFLMQGPGLRPGPFQGAYLIQSLHIPSQGDTRMGMLGVQVETEAWGPEVQGGRAVP